MSLDLEDFQVAGLHPGDGVVVGPEVGRNRERHVALLVGAGMDVAAVDMEPVLELHEVSAGGGETGIFGLVRVVAKGDAEEGEHAFRGGRIVGDDVGHVGEVFPADIHRPVLVDDVQGDECDAVAKNQGVVDENHVVLAENPGAAQAAKDAIRFRNELFLIDAFTGVEVQGKNLSVAGHKVDSDATHVREGADDSHVLHVLLKLVLHDLLEQRVSAGEFGEESAGVDGLLDQVVENDVLVVQMKEVEQVFLVGLAAATLCIVVQRDDGVGDHATVGEVAVDDEAITVVQLHEPTQDLTQEIMRGMDVVTHTDFHL